MFTHFLTSFVVVYIIKKGELALFVFDDNFVFMPIENKFKVLDSLVFIIYKYNITFRGTML